MHAAAKAQIKNAMKKNKSGDPRFLTITAALKARLQSAVGEHYWKKAQDNLSHFLKQKRKELQLRATKLLSSGHQDADEDVMMPLTKKSCRRADNAGTNNGGGDV